MEGLLHQVKQGTINFPIVSYILGINIYIVLLLLLLLLLIIIIIYYLVISAGSSPMWSPRAFSFCPGSPEVSVGYWRWEQWLGARSAMLVHWWWSSGRSFIICFKSPYHHSAARTLSWLEHKPKKVSTVWSQRPVPISLLYPFIPCSIFWAIGLSNWGCCFLFTIYHHENFCCFYSAFPHTRGWIHWLPCCFCPAPFLCRFFQTFLHN